MKKDSILKTSLTDWERIDAMTDDQIDYSDSPKVSRELFSTGRLKPSKRSAEVKEAISIRLDKDVLEWFRARGRGYQSEVNALLRVYMQQHERQS
jgi:uncharacterized protein (DUF4415 family)